MNMNLLIDSPLSISLVVVTFSILLLVWKKKQCLPPGPRGLPILGYLPYFIGSKNLHIQFAELAKKYGPIYKLWLGNKLCVVISSASLAKEVIRDHDVVFANKSCSVVDLILSYNAKDVAFSHYGTQWRMSRRVFVAELMSNNSLDETYDFRRNEVRKEIRNVHSKIGRPVNIAEVAGRVILNAVLRMTWGNTIGLDKGNKISETDFLSLVSSLTVVMGKPNISDFFPFLAKFDIQGIAKETKALMQKMDKVLEGLIDISSMIKSEKVDKTSKDFLQMLVELMDKEDYKMSLTRTHIKGILLNVIGGGTATSVATVEWAMAELMKNPKEMEKVHKELNEVVGLNNTVEEFHIPKLEYLDAVLKETMRLHPAGPFLTLRSPSESCIVGGFTNPKGCTIFLSAWSIQRDPLFWDNPLEFKPQRFLGNNENLDFNGLNLNYIPFGSGRRICAGQALAKRMTKYILASLLHSFEWNLSEGQKLDMEDNYIVALSKTKPLVVVPIPRLSEPNLYV